MTHRELEPLLLEHWPGLSGETRDRVSRFRELILTENQLQNLTKLTAPLDFVLGHVLDVRELGATGWLAGPALDLGSGCGVPGLLFALVNDRIHWVLAESEKRKAAFLVKCVEELGVSSRVSIFSGRAEEFLRHQRVSEVVSRAVGKVSTVYPLIRSCSTWNTLVLFKGPGWTEEWSEFSRGRYRSELRVAEAREYEVGSQEKKRRVLVRLERVPRGTSGKQENSSCRPG